jgi:general secretion pathway protein F
MTRRYLAKRETLQLCQTLYLTLSSGGGLSEGIRAAASTTRLATWQDMLTKAHQKIEAGQSVTQALLDNPRIDPMASNILKTGEESDQLTAVLPPAIASLQSQTSQTLSQAVKLMTPLITIGIGLAVGAIILSTISAIMDLNDAVF